MKHFKRKKSIFCLFICLCMTSIVGHAQNTIKLQGKVFSEGAPVIGATILVKGTQTGTISDVDGNYSLSAASNAVLVVSAVGYQSQEVAVNNRTTIFIELEWNVIGFEDVVVIGYGTQRKVNLTGAVTAISSADLDGKPVTNVVEALQGTAAGLVIQQSNSQPGTRPSINIRGLNTMNNNDPMVIIDGIQGDIQNVNPSDIESISVLKDASSTAIYGSRASNGVILITTKKGASGKNEVLYEFRYGTQQPTFLPKVVDSWIYAEMRNEALVNSGRSAAFSSDQIAYYRNGGPNVKWMEEIYKNNSPQQSHNVSLTGGTDKTTYLVSAGYMDQNSMFKGPGYGIQRYNARTNFSHEVSKRLKITTNVAYTRNEIKDHAYWTEWLIEQATRMPSIYPIKDENGYTFPSGSNSNALARLEQGGYRQISNDDLSGVFNADFKILDGLMLRGMVGGQLLNNRTHENRKAINLPSSGDVDNSMTEQFYRTENITTNLMLTYNKSFDKHNLGGMIGYAYEGSQSKNFQTSRRTDTSDYDIMVGQQTNNVSNQGGGVDWAIYSGFARLNYNYDERYLFEANVRNDVSSKFAKGNRSAWFPSFSAAWRVSEESFYNNLEDYITSMKLRGSWGLVGNNRIDDYAYMAAVSIMPGYNFGNSIVNIASFASANPDIKWETTSMTNAGIDLGFLNNRLNVTFDYFNNVTNDILIGLPVPGMFGSGAPIQNAAKVRNQGWEISVNYHFKTGEFRHSITGNLSDAKNKVLDTRGEYWINGQDINTIIREGYPMNSYYAYRWNGFFQNDAEVASGPHLDGIIPKPGDIRYIDKNNDGSVKEDDDRFILGDNFPHYTFGFSYGLKWRGFDFFMFWQGVGERNVWLRGESVEAFHNNNEGPVFDFHLDRWTPGNPNASYPRLTMGSESANNAAKSDFWIQDASYLRLKNMQIGYTFPKEYLNKLFAKDLRIFLTGQNMLTFTNLKGGWDPETSDGGGRIYPVSRVYSFGLNIKF